MLTRIIALRFALIICVGAPAVTLAISYSFSMRAVGRLHEPIRFTFSDDRGPKNITSFIVSERTPDHRWKPVWSVSGKIRASDVIEYGVTHSGFKTSTLPKALVAGRVYAAFADDGHGGSAMLVFRFDREGTMRFPTSLDG
jgi:hypothetical protein